MKMRWLLGMLITVGFLTVLGLLRPWNEMVEASTERGFLIFGITLAIGCWVILPMVAAWVFLRRNGLPITRVLLRLYIAGLLFLWGLGAIVSLVDPTFEANLGLLFWPVIEWIGLFGIFVVWVFEGARKQNPKAH